MMTRKWMVGTLLLVGCSTNDGGGITEPPPPPVPSSLVGSWYGGWRHPFDSTRGESWLAPEIWLTFNSDWTFWIGVKDDSLGLCDPGPNCSYGGEFSATPTPSSSGPDRGQFSLDPGTVGEVTLNYSIKSIGFNIAFSMTATGNIAGIPITLNFSSWPGYSVMLERSVTFPRRSSTVTRPPGAAPVGASPAPADGHRFVWRRHLTYLDVPPMSWTLDSPLTASG